MGRHKARAKTKKEQRAETAAWLRFVTTASTPENTQPLQPSDIYDLYREGGTGRLENDKSV